MCFGSSKDKDIFDADAPRPSYNQPQQPSSSAVPPKASMPPSAPQQYQKPQQQYQQPAELSAPPPVELSADNDFAPPPGPPPSHTRPTSNQGLASNNPFRNSNSDFAPPPGPPPSHRPQNDDFAPPPGPPPAHRTGAEEFAPPPGPPPSHRAGADDFAPPPGPPPSHQSRADDLSYVAPPPGPPPSHSKQDDYAQPPPGPPPSHGEKKPEHDWQTLVPDTALFPPPPSFFSGFDRSPATNATEVEAEHGEQWCRDHPLTAPIHLDHQALEALNTHNIRLMEPTTGFRGSLTWRAPGIWSAKTDSRSLDSCIIGYPPMYSVTQHSPLASPSGKKTIYYEVFVKKDGNHGDVCLALGYTALPYPSFRMPGWHRGSLAVHGDDGHKFINDRWGGKSFTEPFKRGERYGIGMTFTAANVRVEVDIFFTRQGREIGRWNLHEEGDSEQDLPVTGLEGFHDLSCAIGTYTGVDFDIIFDPNNWLYRPDGY
ncbi:SPRY domain containing protein [Naviculisporaceae sp. PSN 640]